MDNFDHEYYINNNPDLKNSNINTKQKAINHYLTFGQSENRPVRFKEPKYYFSVLMMFKDEESILREWLEYYLLLGTDHFYLFNHGSTDKSPLILRPYIEKGLVTLNNFTAPFTEIRTMLNNGLQLATGNTKWLAIIDSDEFIVPKTTTNIKDFLKDYESYGGLAINWQMFGTSNIDTIPANNLMIELLVTKADAQHEENTLVKSIVQPSRVQKVINQHICQYIDCYYAVTEHKSKVEPLKTSIPVNIQKIQINHYFTRDKSFLNTKIKRRKQLLKESAETTLHRYNMYNTTIDLDIQKYVPELKKRILNNI
jgi:hypothetical protein